MREQDKRRSRAGSRRPSPGSTIESPDLTALNSSFRRGLLPEFLGIEFEEVSSDSVRASLRVDKRHLRPGGIVNGGVYLLLIETLGSISASLRIDMDRQNALGIQVAANHLGIAREGDTLIAVSRPVHVGRSTHVWDVDVRDRDGRALSTGRITLLIVARDKPS
jgi:1,4-dihydroxy-2-naphthoyl-CoA hydrolase